MKKKIAILLCATTLCALTACSNVKSANDLTKNMASNDISPIEIVKDNSQTEEITQFALDIFRTLGEEENILISPLSIISALSMTANGANGETLTQMEAVFHTDLQKLNDYLYAYKTYLPNEETYQVHLANSIWLKDSESLFIRENFLQTNANYYDAQVFQESFDHQLPAKVNAWVLDHTAGMIDQVLQEHVVPTASMYLINALSFDAEWDDVYEETSIRTKEFTNYDGSKSETEMMYGDEYTYLEVEGATGFKKYYDDCKYSFVALLPENEIDIYDFVGDLQGESLVQVLENQRKETVHTSIPKFSTSYDKELKDVLVSLGMPDAFDESCADFSRMVTTDSSSLYIEQVIHKTKIDVDELGTKAGAVTVVAMTEGACEELVEIKEVYLNRPFFYMIVDEAQQLPLFMGVYTNVPS